MNLRKGTAADVPEIMRLVRELAEFEKAPEQVTNTEERMLREGFGEQPAFGVFVVETDAGIVGMALYYFRYSTWKGRRLYLEDIIVSEPYRGEGYGKILFEEMIAEARRTDCTGLMFQVLDWNEPAINFYKKYNTRFDSEWLNCHIDF